MHNNHAHRGQQLKYIADIAAAAAAEQHNSRRMNIAVAPARRQNSGRSSSTITSCTPEAAPGTTVEAGEPCGARDGNA